MFAGGGSAEVVIEEFLEGEEASFFALTDGETILAFGSAQDHKRVGDGDTGPNTGGMGAYSPAPVLTPELEQRAMDEIVAPTVAAMAAAGTPYSGVLYAGLMLTADGPKLIEYNARFGDPECQVLMTAAGERSARADARVRAKGGSPRARSVFSTNGADRGDGGQGLSRHARRQAARSPGSTPPRRRARTCSTPAPPGTRRAGRVGRTRAGRDRAGADVARRSGRPIARSTRSTSRAAFAGATSAGAKSRAKEREKRDELVR